MQERMASPEVSSNPTEFQKVARAAADLEQTVTAYREYEQLQQELAEAKELAAESAGCKTKVVKLHCTCCFTSILQDCLRVCTHMYPVRLHYYRSALLQVDRCESSIPCLQQCAVSAAHCMSWLALMDMPRMLPVKCAAFAHPPRQSCHSMQRMKI